MGSSSQSSLKDQDQKGSESGDTELVSSEIDLTSDCKVNDNMYVSLVKDLNLEDFFIKMLLFTLSSDRVCKMPVSSEHLMFGQARHSSLGYDV